MIQSMFHRRPTAPGRGALSGLLSGLLLAVCLLPAAGADDEFGPNPTWSAPEPAAARAKILAWVAKQPLPAEEKQKITGLWPAAKPGRRRCAPVSFRCSRLPMPGPAR